KPADTAEAKPYHVIPPCDAACALPAMRTVAPNLIPRLYEPEPLTAIHVPAQRFPPGSVCKIPAHRFLKAALEVHARVPVELVPCFGCIHGVTQVVTRAISNEGDERLSRARGGQDAIEDGADKLCHFQVRALGAPAKIVAFSRLSAFEQS